MKAKQGHLRIDQKYQVISFDYSSMENATTCQNCGKIIANTATVRGDDGINYIIGQDCAEGLRDCNCTDYWQHQQIKKEYNRKKALIAKTKKHLKINQVFIQDNEIVFYGDDGIWSSKYFLNEGIKKIYSDFNFDLNTIPKK
jgi:hypothetical protein